MAEPTFSPHRRALLMGAGAWALAGCGPARREPARAAAGRLIVGETCPVTPRQTEGPFYRDPRLLRPDIAGGRAGLPLQLRLQIVDAAACMPMARARVDLWQADAAGRYSGFAEEGTDGEVWLRGTQITDGAGVVTFLTIYPGWYEGRAPHIHVKVEAEGGRRLTSQIYFRGEISERVYADPAYARPGAGRWVRNEEDGIYRSGPDSPLAAVVEAPDGLSAALVIALA